MKPTPPARIRVPGRPVDFLFCIGELHSKTMATRGGWKFISELVEDLRSEIAKIPDGELAQTLLQNNAKLSPVMKIIQTIAAYIEDQRAIARTCGALAGIGNDLNTRAQKITSDNPGIPAVAEMLAHALRVAPVTLEPPGRATAPMPAA